MNDKEINQQIEIMENITNFIDHFRSLPPHDKCLMINDNQSKFEELKNELEKLPNTPPPFSHPVNPEYLKSQYQSWFKWAKRNFESMGELKDKMITAKTFIDFLKASEVGKEEDRKFSKLKELINQNKELV